MRQLISLSLMTCLVCHSAQADWPSFLGGVSRNETAESNVPLQWTPAKNVAWQMDLPGHGQSSPIISGDQIYLTAVQGENKETNLVVAHDLATGKQRWQHESASSLPKKNDYYTSRAAPTPVADASGVYAFFESGNLVALTPAGGVRWQRDLLADYGKYQGRFGLGGSLAQTEEHLFVLADDEGLAYLLKVDKQTGQTVWRQEREPRTSWSSPIVMNLHGQQQLVASSSGSVDGYDCETGTLLWQYTDVGGNTVASPLPAGKNRFLVGASPGRNGENSEGAKQSNLLMQINKTEDAFTPEVVWRNAEATSSFGSPIAHDGYAYYTNRAGVLYCIDLNNGETMYKARIGDSNWATPVGVGDRVYVFQKSGETKVMATGPKEKVLAENRLYESTGGGGRGNFGAEIQYGFAMAKNGFVVRTGSRLFRIQ